MLGCAAGDRLTPEISSCMSCPSLKTRKDDRHADETHPSSHNAISSGSASIETRRKENDKRAKELFQAVGKGRVNVWGRLMARREIEHQKAFMQPKAPT